VTVSLLISGTGCLSAKALIALAQVAEIVFFRRMSAAN
jgi:hypothetical protein